MKLLLFSTMLVIAFQISAQNPTLTSSNFSPAIGDSVVFMRANTAGISIGGSGENQLWDFSQLSFIPNAVIKIKYVNPTTTPFSSSFPNSTIVADFGFRVTYYSATSNEFSETGSVTSQITTLFNDSKIAMKFPFVYGDSYVDTYTNGTYTVSADAVGKLILPNATYEKVLRISTKDITGSTTSLTYNWYDGIHKEALLMIMYSSPGVIQNVMCSKYLTSVTTGIENNLEAKFISSIYPNPANTEVTVRTKLNATVEILNMQGQILLNQRTNALQTTLDISKLSNGVYTIKVRTSNGFETSKFIKR